MDEHAKQQEILKPVLHYFYQDNTQSGSHCRFSLYVSDSRCLRRGGSLSEPKYLSIRSKNAERKTANLDPKL